MQDPLFGESKTTRWKRREKLRRGIYLFPSLFTIANLFFGFYAIVTSMKGEFEISAIMIFLAGVLDFLDGKVARMTKSTSEFGIQFDSLADLVSCGVAPAFLVYLWGLTPLARGGWLVAFLYVISSAMRLARFNIQRSADHRRYFIGLPVPSAAYLVASTVFLFTEPVTSKVFSIFVAAFIVLISLLMISRIKYRSFKDLDLRNRKSYLYIFLIAFAFVAVAVEPKYAVFTLAVIYLISGIIPFLLTSMKKGYLLLATGEKPKPGTKENGNFAEKQI